MKATIVGSELHIELADLHHHLPPEVMKAFAQHAVFKDTVLEAVCDTVAKGECFEDAWWWGGLADQLREKLLPLMPLAVQELCRSKIQEAARMKSEARKIQSRLWELQRHWPSEVKKPEWFDRHLHGEYYPFDREQADAWLSTALGPDEWARIKAECGAQQEAVS